MSTTNCPACSAEINEGVATCPKCGAPLDALEGLETGMVDNSAAIDAMLRSATQLMKDTEQFSFDDSEAMDTYFSIEPPSNAGAKQQNLSPRQAGELSTGAVVNLTETGSTASIAASAASLAASAPAPAPAPVPPPQQSYSSVPHPFAPAPQSFAEPSATPPPPQEFVPTNSIIEDEDENSPMLAELDENGNEIVPVPKDEPKEKLAKKAAAEDNTVKPGRKASPAAMIPWLVIMVVVGGAIGFFLHSFLFGEKAQPHQYHFAEKAAVTLQSSFTNGEALLVYDAFVKESAADTECVIYGGIRNSLGEVENQWFRFTVEKNAPDVVNIYYELDPDYYYQLKSSDDPQMIITAAVLKNYDTTLKTDIEEIKSGSDKWTAIDHNALNQAIRPFEIKSADGADSSATEASPSSDEEEDVTDLA